MNIIKHRRLVDGLIKKTADGSLDWQKTAEDDVFQIVFTSSTLRFSRVYNFSVEGSDYIFDLINDEGELIEKFSDVDLDDRAASSPNDIIWYQKCTDLFDIVKMQATGLDKIMDEILMELEK